MLMDDEELDEIWDEVICPPHWSITIDTEAETEGDRMGQIPFCLYGVENASMTVDWGDGTVETYALANAVENTCPTHQYAAAGEYTIRMESDDFNRLYLWTYLYGEEGDPYVYHATLKFIDEPLPQIAGVHGRWYNEDTDEEEIGDVDNSFYGCFQDCSSLQSIPAGLFDKNTAVTRFDYCFYGCSALTGFTVNVRSANVTNASDFVTKKTGVTRIVKVPSGSTSQTTFNSVASSLGLTIQTL